MKTKNVLLGSALALMIGMASCNSTSNNEDAKETAEAINDSTINSTASTDSTANAQEDDAEAVVEIASGGMMEVELAKIAVEKATSSQVKSFAKMLVTDHTKANEELKALATSKNITLPSSLSDKHQKMLNDISEESGKKFDKEYMNMMVKDHKDDIDKFQKIADKGNDAEIKAFASKTLPVLIHHREEAEKIEKMTDKM